MQASFTVTVNGLGASVKVASKGGVFEAQLPLSTTYSKTDPKSFGFTDPAQLLDPNTGLSNLLVTVRASGSSGQVRLSGELLDEVTFTVPGPCRSCPTPTRPSR